MKVKKSGWLVSLASAALMLGSISASAMEEAEMNDTEYCESEAEQAGMVDGDDVREYVAQCLDEIRSQEEGDSENNNDQREGDGENESAG